MLSPEQLLNKDLPQQTGENEFIPFYDILSRKDGSRTIKINYLKLINLLKQMGYRRYDIGKESFMVRVKENVVEEVTEKNIIDDFETYLHDFPDNLPDGVLKESLLNKIYGGISTYFSKNILQRLTDHQIIEFSNHTRTEAFFYYRNGYTRVTKNGVELLPYSSLDKKIWKNQILNRDFKLIGDEEWNKCSFVQFVKNISNFWSKRPDGKENIPDKNRYENFKNIMGYLMHGYFEGKLKAIVLTDSRISEDPSGRTGKTLIFKAMGHMLNSHKHAATFSEINGKDFEFGDRFKYQELGLDTKLVHLNDVKRNFPFEELFNDITEGIKRQRKNESPVVVNAKMGVSTNLTIRIHGDSAKDRSIEFELADYYSASVSPENEFGEWFFRDWNKAQWNQFDNFMLHCVQCFFERGLRRPKPINLMIRKLQEETCTEFVLWMDERRIGHEDEIDKKMYYEWFMREHTTEGFEKWLKQRTFTKWLQLYAEFHGDFSHFKERRSNGRDLIVYYHKNREQSE